MRNLIEYPITLREKIALLCELIDVQQGTRMSDLRFATLKKILDDISLEDSLVREL